MQDEMFPIATLSKDPYKVLGISSKASAEEIKKAYFSLIAKYTPEKNPEAFKKIRAAYDQIRSQKRREETDFLLFDEGESGAEYQPAKGAIYNLWDDILTLEFWRSATPGNE